MTFDCVSSLGDCLLAGSLEVVLQCTTTSFSIRLRHLCVSNILACFSILVVTSSWSRLAGGRPAASSTGSPSSHLRWWTSHRTLVQILCFLHAFLDYIVCSSHAILFQYEDHHFEMAAVRPHVKDLWMSMINEACSAPPVSHLKPVSSPDPSNGALDCVAPTSLQCTRDHGTCHFHKRGLLFQHEQAVQPALCPPPQVFTVSPIHAHPCHQIHLLKHSRVVSPAPQLRWELQLC